MPTRFLRYLPALGVAFACLAAQPSLALAQTKHGDVSGEGIVSALDAQAILTAVVGLPLPSGYIVANGVAVCDGRATPGALDAQVVLSYAIGLPVTQYCVGQPFGPAATMVVVQPTDSSVLVNRTLVYKAVLKQANGSLIRRPIAWSSSAPAVATVDSVRGDSLAFVRGVAGGSSTITATSDGASFMTQLKVFLSYAGIVITPQRPPTVTQIGARPIFYAKDRDSVGVLSGAPAGFWTVTDTTIAKVVSPGRDTAGNAATVQTLAQGTTYLRVRSQVNPAAVDSVAITTALPTLAVCTEGTGTLHQNVTYASPQTWTIATQPHFVAGTVTFAAGANLTIQPGTLVCLNSGATLAFNAGARLIARGKPDSLIKFVATNPAYYWYYLKLGDASSYALTAPADTSFITNALVENSYYGIYGMNQHLVVADSVRVRQYLYNGVQVLAPGSRLSRSVVDTNATGYNGYAVTLGRGTVESTTIRNAAGGIGIFANDSGTVKAVTITGGKQGITSYYSYANRLHLNDVTITGTSDIALDLQNSTVAATSANVKISGGTGGAFRGEIGNLGILYPDSVGQTTLMGNGKDTLFVTGGYMYRDTVAVRPDLPWLVSNFTYIDTLSRLQPRPGARIIFSYGGLYFTAGGTLDARGENLKPISFVPKPGSYWSGLSFYSPGQGSNTFATAPVAQSTLINVRVDSAQGAYTNTGPFYSYAAINAGDRHRLTLDSVVVHKAFNGAVYLGARGSTLSRSLIDTTGNPTTSYHAVALGDSTTMTATLVRRAGNATGGAGVYASGAGVRLINDTIVNGLGVGLQADAGIIAGNLANVRITGNKSPAQLRIENLGLLARDSVSQLQLLGNTDNTVFVTGGNLQKDTVTTIPQLPWRVDNWVYFDTLSQYAPRPGAKVTFSYGAMYFRAGGTLNARGTSLLPISFTAVPGSYWYGLAFYSPGAGTNPFATAPVAQSTLINVKVDSAQGVSTNTGPFYSSAAINAGDRHRLTIDSTVVRHAFNGAVYLGARGSTLSRSRIDTTGNPTTTYSAVALGDSTTMTATLVRRAGNATGGAGVYAYGAGVSLVNDTILNGLGVGLQAQDGIVAGNLAGVKIMGNKYPARFRIENLGLLARDSISQLQLAGNTDSVIFVTGGTLRKDTVKAIAPLRWQVENYVYFDTLSRFNLGPGSRVTFAWGGLQFQAGGTMDARGTFLLPVRFQPAPGGYFAGLSFYSPGAGTNAFATAPRAASTLINVRVDSAQGAGTNSGFYGSAAINAGDRHKLTLDSIMVHKAFAGAVHLGTRGSSLARSTIDTTGNPTTGYSAVALTDSTTLTTTTVRRSGGAGILVQGQGIVFSNVRVTGSVGVGIDIYYNTRAGGSRGLALSSFKVDSGSVGGVAVEADTVTLTNCLVRDNGTTTGHHGIYTTYLYQGVVISACDLTNNKGYGVFNYDSIPGAAAPKATIITANNNWWGDPAGPAGPLGDGVGGNVTSATPCTASCSGLTFPTVSSGSGVPGSPAVPVAEYVWQRPRRKRRKRRRG